MHSRRKDVQKFAFGIFFERRRQCCREFVEGFRRNDIRVEEGNDLYRARSVEDAARVAICKILLHDSQHEQLYSVDDLCCAYG